MSPAAWSWRVLLLTTLALVAFAANSVLARMALGPGAIDPATYTSIRLISGAVTLWLIVRLVARQTDGTGRGSWISAAMLFLYAIFFSYAYISVETGMGALILFGVVQATMILAGLRGGERPHPWQWLGLAMALSGLVYLMSPGLSAPSPLGATLMTLAGIAWGVYSLLGRGATRAISMTADNFIRTVPMTALISMVMLESFHVTTSGAMLAVLSGAVTSGIGYSIWYTALPALSALRAATVQLAAPVLAAIAGVVWMAEVVSLRLVLSALFILGGVALTVVVKERLHRP